MLDTIWVFHGEGGGFPVEFLFQLKRRKYG